MTVLKIIAWVIVIWFAVSIVYTMMTNPEEMNLGPYKRMINRVKEDPRNIKDYISILIPIAVVMVILIVIIVI